MPDSISLVGPPPLLSVVIAARNAATTLPEQLAALAQQDLDDGWDLIVVNNGSTDNTRELLTVWQRELPILTVVDCALRGANRARNAGVAASCAEAVIFCDADDVVGPGWLKAMSRALNQYDIVGGRLDYSLLNRGAALSARVKLAANELARAPGDFRYAVGANLGVRRAVLRAVGGFDDSFTFGSDEIDLCVRAQCVGYSIGFAPDAVVHYRVRDSILDLARQHYRYARGYAHVHRKLVHERLIAPQSRGDLRRNGITNVRRVARIDRLLDESGRWIYARDAAWAMGAAAGFLRFGVVV